MTNTLTRFHESQADYFGIDSSRASDGWARVTLKLGAYRKLEPMPLEACHRQNRGKAIDVSRRGGSTPIGIRGPQKSANLWASP